MVLASDKCQPNGRSIALAVTVVILMSVAPHQGSAKGGIKSFCCFTTRAEAAPITSPHSQPTTVTIGGCGGKRYRDPITHHCRGPADFGH